MKTVSIAAALLIAACNTPSAYTRPDPSEGNGDYFVLRSGANVTEVFVSDMGLSGPSMNVTLIDGEALRGYSNNQTVDLEWTGAKVKGFVGSQPVDLTVTREKNGVTVRGLFAGRLGTLMMARDKVEGTMGSCSYSFHATGDAGLTYEGLQTCQSLQDIASLRLPIDLTNKPAGEIGGVVALLFGR